VIDLSLGDAQAILAAGLAAAVGPIVRGSLAPLPGGVPIRDGHGALIGAVGVSGDSSESDGAAASQAVAAAGMTPDCGED
jgi:uncharacterized protein GlcG (DUF336 family)